MSWYLAVWLYVWGFMPIALFIDQDPKEGRSSGEQAVRALGLALVWPVYIPWRFMTGVPDTVRRIRAYRHRNDNNRPEQ